MQSPSHALVSSMTDLFAEKDVPQRREAATRIVQETY